MMEQQSRSDAHRTYRILIIDDNEAIHRDFRSLLQRKPTHDDLDDLALEIFGDEEPSMSSVDLPTYSFDSAFQGRAAVETVKQASSSGQSYALAFVDVRMPPGWDGVETIQRIWEIDPNIQMVICSAYSDYTWEELVEALGPSDKLLLLRKPFDPECVKQMTLSITQKWLRDQASGERVTRLEELLRSRDRELESARAELEQLAAELEEVKALATVEASVRAERSRDLGVKMQGLVAALENLPASALSAEERELVAQVIRSGRELIDDLMGHPMGS